MEARKKGFCDEDCSESFSKISQGLSVKYEERAKQNKSSIDVNYKIVNADDFNGSESFKKMQKGLKKSEKKSDVKEISFNEDHT